MISLRYVVSSVYLVGTVSKWLNISGIAYFKCFIIKLCEIIGLEIFNFETWTWVWKILKQKLRRNISNTRINNSVVVHKNSLGTRIKSWRKYSLNRTFVKVNLCQSRTENHHDKWNNNFTCKTAPITFINMESFLQQSLYILIGGALIYESFGRLTWLQLSISNQFRKSCSTVVTRLIWIVDIISVVGILQRNSVVSIFKWILIRCNELIFDLFY